MGLPFDYAVRNLGRSWNRLLLSIGGSLLVGVLVLAAGGFVRGMNLALTQTGDGNNVIVLGAGSEESIERSEILASTPSLLAATVPGIVTRADVPAVSAEVSLMMLVGIEGSVAQVQSIVRGVTPSALVVHSGVTMVEGRLPVPGADEVMVGRMVATVMRTDDESVEIGKSILIDGRPWKIVGRFAAPGTVFESEIWTPLTDIKAATRRETISCVVVTLDPAEAELDDIVTFTKMRPDLELSVLSESEYYGQLSAFFAPIRLVAWVTAALISVGGIFGGLNTMYAAFASRVREIGTLQSMGYRRGAILWSLVQESVLATMAGSIAACIIGLVFLDGLSVRFSMGAFGIVIDAFVVGIAMLAGVVVGVIGAVPPAWRCLSMSIPESLKSV